MQKILNHFTPDEFREWHDDMAFKVLYSIDDFREYWGAPVTVSLNPDALGRELGDDDESQHNIDRWGVVRAIDFFPKGLNESNIDRAYTCAVNAGFTGIGFYTDTKPSMMMHGDVRPDRTAENPATWVRVDGKYIGLAGFLLERKV